MRDDFLFLFLIYPFFIQIPFWSLTVQEHPNNKQTNKNKPTQTDVKDWSSNIIASESTLAYDLADLKPHPQLRGHKTIQQNFLNCKLFEATSLSITDFLFSALNSCRDINRGPRNQHNCGLVPTCGQSRLWVRHSSVYQHGDLLWERTDTLGLGFRMDSLQPPTTRWFPMF